MVSFPLASGARFISIPDELRVALFPAQLGLFEWTDYFFNWPDADELDIDGRKIVPLAPGLFRARWENSVGLATLQPRRDGKPLELPFQVEILSPKLPTPQLHLRFLSALLNDLFVQSSRLVWSPAGLTARGAQPNRTPPSPLEALDWILRSGKSLEELLTAILRRPSRGVKTFSAETPAAQTAKLDRRAVVALATDVTRWAKTESSESVNGYLPQFVPQLRRESTYDVPENGIAVAFVRQINGSIRSARASHWWPALAEARRLEAAQLETFLNGFIKATGPVTTPKPSFVPRDARYRELWQLKTTFRSVGRPIFAPAERFAQTRDIASLWEYWVFFGLVHAIEKVLGETARLEAEYDEMRGLLAPSRAIFESGFLVFNGPASSYSTPLRPDFLWFHGGKAIVAFDAKFRVDIETNSGRGTDLHKMHAYRDALGVGAAIALHPGLLTNWFDRERGPLNKIPLLALLDGTVGGVGLWGITPPI